MASPWSYTLLLVTERTAVVDGTAFETGGRTGWTARLDVARISGGGSVTVAIEGSPTGADGSWSQAGIWAAQTAEGTPTDLSALLQTPTLTLTARDRYVRARITASVGTHTVGVSIWAPFLDPAAPSDMDLVGKALREFNDGKTRLVERAERDVRSLVLADHETGLLDVDLNDPHTCLELRETIAEQADHLLLRHEAIREGEDVPPDIAPGLLDRLNKLRPAAATVWRGR